MSVLRYIQVLEQLNRPRGDERHCASMEQAARIKRERKKQEARKERELKEQEAKIERERKKQEARKEREPKEQEAKIERGRKEREARSERERKE